MSDINTIKELEVTYEPLLTATITLADMSQTFRFATTSFTMGSNTYDGRIVNEQITATQALSEQGIDVTPQVTLTLADPDKVIWTATEVSGSGFKGATMNLVFVFRDVITGTFSSDIRVLFYGICSAPNMEATTLTIAAQSKMNMNQFSLPTVRVQKLCPKIYPTTAAERWQAANNPESIFYACGYSPDQTGPNARGNYETGTTPFTTCNLTGWQDGTDPSGAAIKSDCSLRGMLKTDSMNRITSRFGGSQWQPPDRWESRGYSDPKWIEGFNNPNEAKYNDRISLVYGTSWVDAEIMDVVGDANQTKMETVLCWGDVGYDGTSDATKFATNAISKVVVNDVEVPWAGPSTADHGTQVATGLFWNYVTSGNRQGNPRSANDVFKGSDPYGSLCVLQPTIPIQLGAATSTPHVQVLVNGPQIHVYNSEAARVITGIVMSGGQLLVTSASHGYSTNDFVTINGVVGIPEAIGTFPISVLNANQFYLDQTTSSGTYVNGGLSFRFTLTFTDNPVWMLLDILRWSQWQMSALDIQTFINAAAIAGENITVNSIFGSTTNLPRFSGSITIRQTQSAAEIIRGIRNSMRALLAPASDTGLLQIFIKGTLGTDQPSANGPIPGSNFNSLISSVDFAGNPDQGYVAYSFSVDAPSNILQTESSNPVPMISIDQRTNQDSPNQTVVQFQDRENAFVWDSINDLDTEDIGRIGQQIGGSFPVLAVNYFDMAQRLVNTYHAETFRGNPRGDSGGTWLVNLTTTYKGTHLRIGHIVKLTWTVAGLTDQLFRIVQIKPSVNCQTMELQLQWHEDIWYTDAWERTDPSLANSARKTTLKRPPFGWQPDQTGPQLGDVVYPFSTHTFAVSQISTPAADGSQIIGVQATGLVPTNVFSTISPPVVGPQGTSASTGGFLLGGRTYYAVVVGLDGNSPVLLSAPSQLCKIVVPAGTSTNTITIPTYRWDASNTAFSVYAGTDPNNLVYLNPTNYNVTYAGLAARPTTITIGGDTAPANPRLPISELAVPDVMFDHLEIGTKLIEHFGVLGATVLSFTSGTISISQGGLTTNQFAGYTLSLLAKATVGTNIPVCNWTITANTTGGVLSVTGPSTTGPLGIGDTVIIRSKPTTITATTLQDPNWVNAEYPSGLVASAEKGNLIRILAGTGVGTVIPIIDNTTDTFTVAAWPVTPDATSLYIVEVPLWDTPSDMPSIINSTTNTVQSILADTGNYMKRSLLVAVWTVDGIGNRSLDAYTPMREIYFTGVPLDPTITLYIPQTIDK